MSGLKGAALTLCVALLLTAVLQYLAPQGLSKELLRAVCGLFVLAVAVQAVGRVGVRLPALQPQESAVPQALRETVRAQEREALLQAAGEAISGLLGAAGISHTGVELFEQNADSAETDGIVLDRIRVAVDSAAAQARARALLSELFPGASIEVELRHE